MGGRDVIESADVILWGKRIGCVVRREGVPYAEFEYDPDFVGYGIEPSPSQKWPCRNVEM